MRATDYAKPIGAACVKRVLVRLVLRKKNAVRQCVRCYFRSATNGDEKVGQTGDRCLIAPLGSAIRRRAHALAIWRLADAVASSRCGIMATVATAPVFSRGCPALDAVSTLSWKSKPASSGKFRRRCAWVPSLCALVRISLHIHLVITGNGARREGMPSSEANNAIVANMGCGIESFAGGWRAIELPKLAQDAGSQRKPMKRGFIRPNVARGRSARRSAPIRAVGPRPDAFPGVPAKGGGRECFRRAQAVPTPGPAPPGLCGLA